MPAASFSLTDGQLTIAADSHRADVVVTDFNSGQIRVKDNITKAYQVYLASDVERIVFTGGPGNDRFFNQTSKPVIADGGAGNDSLIGGVGDDVFMGSAGRDVYIGSGGGDLLIRNGYDVNFVDRSDKNAVVGVVTGRLSPSELKAQGDLDVWLDGDRLWLNGPSGAGFALQSDWQSSTTNGQLRFTTTSDITLESAWGDIPLPASGAPVAIVTTPSRVPGVGIFDSITWAGRDVTFNSPTGEYASQLGSLTGANVGLPSVSWGIALGSDIGDDAAPLNPAVPYLYATAMTGYSFGYQNVSVSPDGSYSGTFAFAPGDGTIYAGITGLPVIGDFALGVSTNGYLPYTPAQIPTGSSDPDIYGHFYVRGQISLDDAGVPVALGGELVLDLDANHDGNLLGGALSPQRIGQLVDTFENNVSQPTKFFGASLRLALADIEVGVNTDIDLTFHGFNLSLSRSSFWLTRNEIAFRAKTSNPFDGIPFLEDVPNPSGLDVQGFMRRNGAWRASFDVQLGLPGGVFVTGLHAEAGSGLGGIRVGAYIGGSLPGIGAFNMSVHGTVFFNGDYSLIGSTEVKVGHVDATLHLGLSKNHGHPRMSWWLTF